MLQLSSASGHMPMLLAQRPARPAPRAARPVQRRAAVKERVAPVPAPTRLPALQPVQHESRSELQWPSGAAAWSLASQHLRRACTGCWDADGTLQLTWFLSLHRLQCSLLAWQTDRHGLLRDLLPGQRPVRALLLREGTPLAGHCRSFCQAVSTGADQQAPCRSSQRTGASSEGRRSCARSLQRPTSCCEHRSPWAWCRCVQA